MSINQKIFKAYDIRGIYPEEINEEAMVIITKAVYTFFSSKLGKKNLSVVIGRDMRLSSPALFDVAQKTLIDMGAQIIDIGLATTPTVYYTVLSNNYDCGIQISASHNPKEYNGVKFFYRNKKKLVKVSKNTGMDDVKQIALAGNFLQPESKGTITNKADMLSKDVEFAFDLVQPTHLTPLKVVADAANSMGALFLVELFKKTPCSLVKMNFELDGTFPAHQADPLQFKTLVDLQKKVVEEKADLGIAPDGDGDRVFFIDERGEIIPATLITALVAREILLKKAGEKILFDVRYTRNPQKVVVDYKGIPVVNVVGHALITEHLNKENGAFAGESSGHFYFRETGGAESSVRVIFYVLEVIGREKKPISEIVKELKSSIESGEMNFILPKTKNSKEILEEIAGEHADGEVSWLDGLSVNYAPWRFSMRVSNTEGLLRLNVEGQTDELVKEKFELLKERILKTGAIVKE